MADVGSSKQIIIKLTRRYMNEGGTVDLDRQFNKVRMKHIKQNKYQVFVHKR